MRDDSAEDNGLLAHQRLERHGVEVKLDKGFAEGTYCVHVEFDDLAARIGFTAARRTAKGYCALLKGHLASSPECEVGQIEDGSRTGNPRRKHDLESTFLWFEVQTSDGSFHDKAMCERFRVASLRAGQAWDQAQAKAQTQRREHRQENFRRELSRLLDSAAYTHVDAETKERLLSEVPALAFPRRGVER